MSIKRYFSKNMIKLALRYLINKLKNMKSWVTTLFAVLAAVGILAGLVSDCITEVVCNWQGMVDEIMVIVGLLGFGAFARDDNKSSEDVGAK